jgi:hypothetical protein
VVCKSFAANKALLAKLPKESVVFPVTIAISVNALSNF